MVIAFVLLNFEQSQLRTNLEESVLEKLFSLSKRGTTVKTEILAGITTFMTMSYILAVNPNILGQAGMDTSSVFAATAISAAFATAVMALAANLPAALAPGMGLNAFFAFGVVIGMGYTWQFALTAVFLEGLIFIFLTITNMREAILKCIPYSMKLAISAGIGFFVAFIGFQNAGIIVKNDATMVSLGSMATPGVLVAVAGLLVAIILMTKHVRGALLISIVIATLIGIPLGITNMTNFNAENLFTIPSIAPTFWQFEWESIFTLDMLVVLITFLFVDLFDTLGTLLALGAKANLLDDKGQLPRAKPALMADALGTTVGAILGTSTVTSYVESASGVIEGGRTGLTSIVVSILFFLSLFLSPFFLVIPAQATAPVLILVGLLMFTPALKIDFNDYVNAIPAFLTIIIMPLSYSIATGIMWGIISHMVLSVFSRRLDELSPLSYILSALFIWKMSLG